MSAHADTNVVEVEFGEGSHGVFVGLPEEVEVPGSGVPLESQVDASLNGPRGFFGRVKPSFFRRKGPAVKTSEPTISVEASDETGKPHAASDHAAEGVLEDQAAEAAEVDGQKPKGRSRAKFLGFVSAGALAVALGGILLWPQEHQTAPIHVAASDGTKDPQHMMAPLATLAVVPPREAVPDPVEVRPKRVPKGDVVAEIAALGPSGDNALPLPPTEPAKVVASTPVKVVDDGKVAPVVQEVKEPGVKEAPVLLEKKEVVKTISPAEETEVMGMITEVSALIKKTREEIGALRGEQKKLAEATNTKLADFERRLSFGEARRGIESAKAAGTAEPAQTPAPGAAEPQAPASYKGNLMPVRAMAPARTSAPKVETVSVGGAGQGQFHYRVRAASPNLAMLMTVEETGDESKPVQVAVGGEVPGYGKVKRIAQHGIAWVVETEKGEIR